MRVNDDDDDDVKCGYHADLSGHSVSISDVGTRHLTETIKLIV